MEHTLENIAAALGKPDPSLLEALLDGTTEAQLVGKGNKIASPRVITDMRRLYAHAYSFWQSASDAQKETLRGFSPELLAVAVEEALGLEVMVAAHEETGDARAASRATLEAALRDAFDKALGLRDQAHGVLLAVAGSDAATQEEVQQAVGTAEDAGALVRGLGALVAIAKRFLSADAGPALAKRAKLMRLDTTYIEKLEKAASAFASAAQAATARPAGKQITQGTLDRADGVNLLLLTLTVRAFDDAHEQDPTIPRLVPIATRRLFDRTTRKKKTTGETGAANGA